MNGLRETVKIMVENSETPENYSDIHWFAIFLGGIIITTTSILIAIYASSIVWRITSIIVALMFVVFLNVNIHEFIHYKRKKYLKEKENKENEIEK